MDRETVASRDPARHRLERLELGDAFLELDGDWRIVRIDRDPEAQQGAPREEPLGRSFWEVWPETASPDGRYWRECHRCMDERVPVQFEDPLAPLGRWTRVTAYPVSTGGIAVLLRDETEKKRAEAALQASEERLRSILENMSEGVMLFDAGANLVYQNPASLRIHGFGPEAGGRISRDRLPGTWNAWDEQGRAIAFDEWPVSRVFRGERFQQQVLRVERAETGRVFHGSYNGSPIRDAEGRITLGFITIRDITEQVRAEREARAAARATEDERRRLQTVLDALPAGVAIADSSGAFTHVNAELRRIWGGPPSPRDVNEYGAWHGWWSDGRPIPAQEWALARAITTGETIVPGDLVDIEKFDGTGRATIVNAAAPIRDGEGRIVGGVLAEVDVTVQRRAEAAARAAEQRMGAVVEHLPSGLVVADLTTGALHWNAEALRIHGYTGEGDEHLFLESLVAEHDLRTLAGEPIPVHRWPLPRVLAGEPFRDYEILVRNTRLGWERVFRYSGAVIRGDDGVPAIGLLAIEDVSARSRAETALRAANERLLEADRRKDDFLGMLSHELRNPLAPIRNALFILEHARPEGQQARRAKDIASRQVAHLTRLVDDLLDVTRIARGKVELRHEDLDLTALVRRTAEDYRPLMQDRGLELAVELPAGPVQVNGDPARLTQIFGNLLNNAAKFTPAGGRVSLSLAQRGDRAVAQVSDSGPGIAPDLLPRLFEPFTQGKQTLARTEGGLGLGLSLVKGLVAMHGGEVSVRNRERGGAEFAVALPARPRAAVEEARAGAPGATAAAPRHRVLVVDDNRDAAESLGELVQLLGHEVDLAFDGPSAIVEAGKMRPDVVLCDLGLPGMDGYQVARALRAQYDGAVHLVALSGYAQPEDVARALDAGFDRHVAKPPDPSKLEQLLT